MYYIVIYSKCLLMRSKGNTFCGSYSDLMNYNLHIIYYSHTEYV